MGAAASFFCFRKILLSFDWKIPGNRVNIQKNAEDSWEYASGKWLN